MTSIELIGMSFLRGEDPLKLWKEFRRNCNELILKHIAEHEFEELISEIT